MAHLLISIKFLARVSGPIGPQSETKHVRYCRKGFPCRLMDFPRYSHGQVMVVIMGEITPPGYCTHLSHGHSLTNWRNVGVILTPLAHSRSQYCQN